MKNKEIRIITIICLLIIIVVSVVFNVLQRTKIASYKEDIESYKEKINSLENQVEKTEEEPKYYDCTFTQTYRIVDLLEGYVAEVPEKSYVVVDKFLVHGAYAHLIPTDLKEGLEVNKNYEFTYQIKGTGIIKDFTDFTRYITDESIEDVPEGILRVKLSVKETDKLGLEQIQENICEGE